MRKRLMVLVWLLFTLPAAAATPPNIVFLLVDDLGWGDLGCYGAAFNETPNIDRLAEQGMLFRHAYAACTVCSPSRAAILSGRYPARLHLTDWIPGHERPEAKLAPPDWQKHLDHDRVLLPEALRAAGYATAFLGKWHLTPTTSQKDGVVPEPGHDPTDHGFDLNVGGNQWGQPRGKGRYFSPFEMPNLDDGAPGDFLTDRLTDEAVAFLDRHAAENPERPFLLYFSYYTVHGPLMAPEERMGKYREKAKRFAGVDGVFTKPERAAMVEILDDSVGRVLDQLDKMGVADHTIVVLTGDNGGDRPETSGGLRDFKGHAREGSVREPLLVRWPGRIAAGASSDVPVIGTDFYPTLLELAGLPARADEHVDGVSLAGLLTGAAEDLPRESLFWHYPHNHRTTPYGAVRSGDWKLYEFYEDGRLELYHLGDDPAETTDLAEAAPGTTRLLHDELVGWRSRVDAQMPVPNPAAH